MALSTLVCRVNQQTSGTNGEKVRRHTVQNMELSVH